MTPKYPVLKVMTASISRYEQERLIAYSKLCTARAATGLNDLRTGMSGLICHGITALGDEQWR